MQLELSARRALGPAGLRLPRLERALPPVLAVLLGLGIWEAVALLQLEPDYVLPGPLPVLGRLAHDAHDQLFWMGVGQTMLRAVTGYAAAIVIGFLLGMAVVGVPLVRAAFGSLLAAVQTMPSIAWFPLAILLFRLSESAILFVVVLGAAPSIAGGLISGVDHVQPLLVRSGRSIGARGLLLYRHVILPAALPGFVAGMRQAWAFAWRSLMAGELLVQIGAHPSLGTRLHFASELADAEGLLATMLVILAMGIAVDVFFSRADRAIRRRRGLLES